MIEAGCAPNMFQPTILSESKLNGTDDLLIKRGEGEWFALSPEDANAFMRWKRIS